MIFNAKAQGLAEIPVEWSGKNRLAGTEMITLNVKDLPLAQVAQVLGQIYQEPLAIPAERAYSAVKLSVKDMALADIVNELGLITVSGKKTGKRRPRAKST